MTAEQMKSHFAYGFLWMFLPNAVHFKISKLINGSGGEKTGVYGIKSSMEIESHNFAGFPKRLADYLTSAAVSVTSQFPTG